MPHQHFNLKKKHVRKTIKQNYKLIIIFKWNKIINLISFSFHYYYYFFWKNTFFPEHDCSCSWNLANRKKKKIKIVKPKPKQNPIDTTFCTLTTLAPVPQWCSNDVRILMANVGLRPDQMKIDLRKVFMENITYFLTK